MVDTHDGTSRRNLLQLLSLVKPPKNGIVFYTPAYKINTHITSTGIDTISRFISCFFFIFLQSDTSADIFHCNLVN